MAEGLIAVRIAVSKSIANRAMILQSFQAVKLLEEGACNDIAQLRKALHAFQSGESVLDCGEGGTVLRFLLARVSREAGHWHLLMGPSLRCRPHQELMQALSELGVSTSLTAQGIEVRSKGWQAPRNPLRISCERSSQFLSAILLSSAHLHFDLEIDFSGNKVSEPYLAMTLALLDLNGIRAENLENAKLRIRANQTLSLPLLIPKEPDLSSTFALAALASVKGRVLIDAFPLSSLQPDASFVHHLRSLGAYCTRNREGQLLVEARDLHGVDCDLGSSPDLFPCLASLAGIAKGSSRFFGATQLNHKESPRIQKISELLSLIGRPHEVKDDGILIGAGLPRDPKECLSPLAFDPANDHRMVMAADILIRAGYPIEVSHRECVTKSFYEYEDLKCNALS